MWYGIWHREKLWFNFSPFEILDNNPRWGDLSQVEYQLNTSKNKLFCSKLLQSDFSSTLFTSGQDEIATLHFVSTYLVGYGMDCMHEGCMICSLKYFKIKGCSTVTLHDTKTGKREILTGIRTVSSLFHPREL